MDQPLAQDAIEGNLIINRLLFLSHNGFRAGQMPGDGQGHAAELDQGPRKGKSPGNLEGKSEVSCITNTHYGTLTEKQSA